MIKPGQVKGSWKIEEDLKLVSLINEKCDNWRQIAAKMEGRSPKQCRERWLLHLNPEIKKTPFTSDEDSILLRLYSEIGNKWTQISRELPGRSDAACKIRYKAIQYCLSKGLLKRCHAYAYIQCVASICRESYRFDTAQRSAIETSQRPVVR